MQGDVELRVGEWQAAVDTFRQATLRFPFLANAFLGEAIALGELGDLDGARTALDMAKSLEASPDALGAVEGRLRQLVESGVE